MLAKERSHKSLNLLRKSKISQSESKISDLATR